MLLENPLFYYGEILQKFPNSYLAEDNFQAIIGIDCDYLDANFMSFDEFKAKYEKAKNSQNLSAKFGGFFGVLGYEIVHKFEKIGEMKNRLYDFPNFFYANAKNYLHYDKISKIYTFFGSNFEILSELEKLKKPQKISKKHYFYKIKTDLKKEEKHFYEMIKIAKEKIKSGDIFQVVLGEILQIDTNLNSLKFYEKLKQNNPSPYMFHFPTPYGVVVGSSPELIMRIKNSEIFVAPIAGTRPRSKDANEDIMLEKELLKDEKELAEHRMLIDLARNDVGKFANTGSVEVKNPMSIVRYESVMHIVSEVYGIKRQDADIFDVLSVVFPAGTLSGSPKIRAMQIINELESSQRGIYGGGIGFLHFSGDVQIAILIRSAIFVAKNGENFKNSAKFLVKNLNSVFIGAGAGIVYDSKENAEYSEICKKRQSCVKVIKELCDDFDN